MGKTHFLHPLLKRAEGTPMLRNVRTGLLVATRLETAFDSADRKKGLLGRDGLAPGQALIIAPTNLVHTFTMRFSIDILFVSKNGRVIKVREAVPPRRIAGAWGGFAVVECGAGQIQQSGTRAGDSIEVCRSV